MSSGRIQSELRASQPFGDGLISGVMIKIYTRLKLGPLC